MFKDEFADAFEKKFLRWIETELKVQAIPATGTNSLYYHFEFESNNVNMVVIGKNKNTAMSPTTSDWILRIEEEDPPRFIPKLDLHFSSEKPGEYHLLYPHFPSKP
jgi:hypothetical protein